MLELGNGPRISLICSNPNFGTTGVNRGRFRANFDFEFWDFLKILEYLFPYKLFWGLVKILWWKLYLDMILNTSKWKKIWVELKWAPRGGPKVGAIGPFFAFFLKNQKYFFLIVTYKKNKPPAIMPKCAPQYVNKKI